MKILGLIFHRSFAPRRLITAYIQGRHGPVRCGAGSTLRTGRECGDRRRCERRRLPRTHPLPRRRPTLCSARQLRAECLPGALWLTSLLPNGLHDPSAPIGSHTPCGSPATAPRMCVYGFTNPTSSPLVQAPFLCPGHASFSCLPPFFCRPHCSHRTHSGRHVCKRPTFDSVYMCPALTIFKSSHLSTTNTPHCFRHEKKKRDSCIFLPRWLCQPCNTLTRCAWAR